MVVRKPTTGSLRAVRFGTFTTVAGCRQTIDDEDRGFEIDGDRYGTRPKQHHVRE